ncbi:hypothetical protein ACH42_04255 [Endozoicomonas sp. (ex Bugula neritina AB1)]|nr:hypothetical protein ACH42_04255 [Endozoicomonas sp. (ex Bugula neritina AB1)]
MDPVHGIEGTSSVNVIDPTQTSQQDFISAVYLERGNMLETEVRRLAGVIEQSNEMLSTVGTLISKADIAQFGEPNFSETSWVTNDNNIVLDNGYSLSIRESESGNSFVLTDIEGNQLVYQNQTLIPVPKGETVDAMKSGIPVMQDLTMVLDDGTEITFQAATPDSPFDSSNFSGGLADIASISITRGNQGVSVSGLDGDNSPVIAHPTVEASSPHSLDSNTNDGYVLIESGGLHKWFYDGRSVATLTETNPNDPDDTISGYFARKLAFHTTRLEEHAGGIPTLTPEEIDVLKNKLNITYSDASGTGNLTPEEWNKLRPSLLAAKDNLTSSNQLQTVELQRALTTFNQNFDAMSNAQSRIYSLLKDIVNNIK